MPSPFLGLIAGALVCQLGLLVTTLYLHRTLSHRALTLRPAATAACRVVLWITTGIRPRQWVAVHRKHHAFTDVEGDPHSPLLEGFAMVQFANAALYRRVARDREAVARFARDLPPDRWDRILFDHALLGLGLGMVALVVAIGPSAAIVAAIFHTVAYLLLNAAINAIGHSFGRQAHANTSFNDQWLAWLTWGEGLHNNHHAAPTSARFALQSGEADPGWWVVRLLERRGWASVRHHEPRLRRAAA